jgi:DNA-binding transcriptional LysR family regulator
LDESVKSIQLANVDLNLLVVFDVVFAERHVGRAAKRLALTPSAVSHGLRRLRELFDDPLFARTPKGVVPTARAAELAAPIGDVLSRVRSMMSSVERFDPARSTRRFTIGAADATSAVLLPRLLSELRSHAPRIDLGLLHLLPQSRLDELESGAIDLVLLALDEVPARFVARVVREERFVIAARAAHPFFRKPTLTRYSELSHLLVSINDSTQGYVDEVLAQRGVSRRVALTVPNFLLALAALSDSDLLAAVPESLIIAHGARFGLASVKPPFRLRRWHLRAVVPRARLADPGVSWLLGAAERAGKPRE